MYFVSFSFIRQTTLSPTWLIIMSIITRSEVFISRLYVKFRNRF